MSYEDNIRKSIEENIKRRKDIVRERGGLDPLISKRRCACCGNVVLWEEMIREESGNEFEEFCKHCSFNFAVARVEGKTKSISEYIRMYGRAKAYDAGRTTCEFCDEPVDLNYSYCRRCLK